MRQEANSSEVARVLDKIENSVAGEQKSTILMALLAGALLFQKSDLTADQIRDGIMGASEWIHVYLTSVENPVPVEKIN